MYQGPYTPIVMPASLSHTEIIMNNLYLPTL